VKIIGKTYETQRLNGLKLLNVPYSMLNEPCDRGCCENELIQDGDVALKAAWLLEEYMPENNFKEFDFNDWTDELELLWSDRINKKTKNPLAEAKKMLQKAMKEKGLSPKDVKRNIGIDRYNDQLETFKD
jgi:hypothetical protein